MTTSTGSYPEIFTALSQGGYSGAIIHFSGGNDEGGVDQIELLKGEERIELNYQEGTYNRETHAIEYSPEDRPKAELWETLSQPIEDEYGSFAGEFYVSGTITVDVASRTMKMNKNERVESYEESSYEL